MEGLGKRHGSVVHVGQQVGRQAPPTPVPCPLFLVGTSALRAGVLWRGRIPSEDWDLPYLASFRVKIAIGRQNCAKLCKSQGSHPKFGPFSSRMRAGQTFPPCPLSLVPCPLSLVHCPLSLGLDQSHGGCPTGNGVMPHVAGTTPRRKGGRQCGT